MTPPLWDKTATGPRFTISLYMGAKGVTREAPMLMMPSPLGPTTRIPHFRAVLRSSSPNRFPSAESSPKPPVSTMTHDIPLRPH